MMAADDGDAQQQRPPRPASAPTGGSVRLSAGVSRALGAVAVAFSAPPPPAARPASSPSPPPPAVLDEAEHAARLATFASSPHAAAWRALPAAVGPEAAARRGWHAQERTLHAATLCSCFCPACGAFLVVTATPEWPQSRAAAVAAAAARLVGAHERGCVWRAHAHPQAPGPDDDDGDPERRRSVALLQALHAASADVALAAVEPVTVAAARASTGPTQAVPL